MHEYESKSNQDGSSFGGRVLQSGPRAGDASHDPRGGRRMQGGTGLKKLRFRRLVLVGALVLALAAGLALATQSIGVTQVIVANALYEGVNVAARRHPDGVDPGWKATLKITGASDIFVNSNTAVPGANGGWHSHPGLSIVSVTQGAVWNYSSEDPNCAPTVIMAGHGFVEPGNHVHLLRNEGTVDAKWTTTAIRPAGSPARIDQPAPPNCPF